jgi:hypothetical protein
VWPYSGAKPDRWRVTRTEHIVCHRQTARFRLTFNLHVSIMFPSSFGSRQGWSDVAFELRRLIFDIVYLCQKDRSPQAGRPIRSRLGIATLTSFTWGCSSDSKKNRTQILTYPRSPHTLTERCVRVEFRILCAEPLPLDMGSIAQKREPHITETMERDPAPRPRGGYHSFSASSVSLR